MIKTLWIALLTMLFTTASWGALTYTYSITANPYTSVGGTPAYYTVGLNASGSFTMASQLAPSLSSVEVRASVTAFSFDDGMGNLITQANATGKSFVVTTDLNGNITAFDVSVSATGTPNESIRFYTGDGGGVQVSYGSKSATRTGNPGSFSMTTAVTPDVATTSVPTLSQWALITLAGLMLAGVALHNRRQRRLF